MRSVPRQLLRSLPVPKIEAEHLPKSWLDRAPKGLHSFPPSRPDSEVAPLLSSYARPSEAIHRFRQRALFSSSIHSRNCQKMDVKAPVLALDPIEDALCTLIDEACQWITETQPQPDPVESSGVVIDYHAGWTCDARIAGGWVRDKVSHPALLARYIHRGQCYADQLLLVL